MKGQGPVKGPVKSPEVPAEGLAAVVVAEKEVPAELPQGEGPAAVALRLTSTHLGFRV